MGTDAETREIFWELKDKYLQKFGEWYGIGVAADGKSLEDHIKIIEKALKTGKPAPDPEFEGIAE